MKDLCGMQFGRLTVLSRGEDIIGRNGKRHRSWNCVCQCGAAKTVKQECLVYGKTKSCGCLYTETRHVKRNVAHGESRTRVYSEWARMIQRCTNQAVDSYPRYGGRGITVCDEWQNSFLSFRDWAFSHGYDDKKTIDRIDIDSGYSPENCRWATAIQQANNKSNNRYIELDGTTHTLMEWCRIYSTPYDAVWRRIYKYGWDPKTAITKPVRSKSGTDCI